MKILLPVFLLIVTLSVFGQSNRDLQALAETEKAFARFAAEKDTKSAFLEFAAPDGIMFNPDPVNAIAYWKARGESKGLLSWQPSFADISSKGALGWTTGPWEFFPSGRSGAAVAWGEFVTLWKKQTDGKFKFVLDVGINHPQAQVDGIEWKSPVDAGKKSGKKGGAISDTANEFFELTDALKTIEAYKTFAAEDIRILREGKMPMLGKKTFLDELKKNSAPISFGKQSKFFSSGELAYTTNSYSLTKPDKTTEKGNFVHIWKLRDGKWQLVFELFYPHPEEKK